MKVNVVFNGILIGAKAKDYTTQGGSRGTSYNLALEHCEEVGNVKCSKAVYDAVAEGRFPKYGNVVLCGVYDTDYKNMVVESVKTSEKK